MIPEEKIRSLAVSTESRIVLLVLDGLGGLPVNGRTELEAADTPYLDQLAAESACGLTHAISPGITPGSGPSHLALFGYDPLKYEIGRGVLEALGVGLTMTDRDVAARGNFATLDGNGIIADRRAGRIPTEKNQQLCAALAGEIRELDGVAVIIQPGKEHRFTVLFRGDGLDGRLGDADPQKNGLNPQPAVALAPEAEATAQLANHFIQRATEVLADSAPANTVLLRGFAKYPDIPGMRELFALHPAAVAAYPMYRGLAQLVGMELIETGEAIHDEFIALQEHFLRHDFFYVHVKKTDSYGEDGNFDAKVGVIEEADRQIPQLLALEPDVIVVTADHSTPSTLKAHSWHPNPLLLWSRHLRADAAKRFSEFECSRGSLGRIHSVDVMPLMLAHALKLEKYGA